MHRREDIQTGWVVTQWSMTLKGGDSVGLEAGARGPRSYHLREGKNIMMK